MPNHNIFQTSSRDYVVKETTSIVSVCFRLYYKIFKKEYGHPCGQDMVSDLSRNVSKYNEEFGEECIKLAFHDEKPVVAICTPLMKRVHQLWRYSSEMAFIDSSGGMDRSNSRVFLLLTHSPVGGLPLGVFVTTSESEAAVKCGLDLLKDILPGEAFFGRGAQSPKVIMTDDSTAERTAIRAVWPLCTLLLCIFHVLQAAWRWLWDSRHGIPKNTRPHLLKLIKVIMMSSTVDELEQHHANLQVDETAIQFDQFVHYSDNLHKRKEEWALCYRRDTIIRANNTNNYAEAGMRILKDNIFNRTKAYNLCQLIDFLVNRLPAFYERKLTDVANNRLAQHSLNSRFYLSHHMISSNDIVKVIQYKYYYVLFSGLGVSYRPKFSSD